jgi:hypothetical protein
VIVTIVVVFCHFLTARWWGATLRNCTVHVVGSVGACVRSGSGSGSLVEVGWWSLQSPPGVDEDTHESNASVTVEDPECMAGTSSTIGWHQFWFELPFACTAWSIMTAPRTSCLFLYADSQTGTLYGYCTLFLYMEQAEQLCLYTTQDSTAPSLQHIPKWCLRASTVLP